MEAFLSVLMMRDLDKKKTQTSLFVIWKTYK